MKLVSDSSRPVIRSPLIERITSFGSRPISAAGDLETDNGDDADVAIGDVDNIGERMSRPLGILLLITGVRVRIFVDTDATTTPSSNVL